MTQIVTIKRKTVKPVAVAEVAHAPHGIAWQEFGGADQDEPTYDTDPTLDLVAFQMWTLDQIDGE